MYGMMHLAYMFGDPLGELVEAAEFWADVNLIDWAEEGFYGRDRVFHHIGRW